MKLAINEVVNKSMVANLGRGITQLDVFFFFGIEVHARSKKVLINMASRCQPSIWLLLYMEFCYPWSLKVEEGQQYRLLFA